MRICVKMQHILKKSSPILYSARREELEYELQFSARRYKMTASFKWIPERTPAKPRAASRKGGGGIISCARFFAAGPALALLTALPAAPPLGAQTTAGQCAPAKDLPEVTYSGALTATPGTSRSGTKYAIYCRGINNPGGVKLTLSGTIGEDTDPVSGTGIGVDTASAAAKAAITIINNGEIYTQGTKGTDGRGINALITNQASTDGITIVNNGKIISQHQGIQAWHEGDGPITVDTAAGSVIQTRIFTTSFDGLETGISLEIDSDKGSGVNGDSTGAVTVNHKGKLYAGLHGIGILSDGKGAMTVTTGRESLVQAAAAGIIVRSDNPAAANTGAVSVTHNGVLRAGEQGVRAYHKGRGAVTVVTGEESSITTTGATVYAVGIEASLWHNAEETSGSGVTVTHEGTISAAADGIFASVRGGSVGLTSAPSSRDAESGGLIRVMVGGNGAVTAGRHGIQVWHHGSGKFDVTVRGKVAGDSGGGDEYAGVHITTAAELIKGSDPAAGGGGTITVGSGGHVSASGTAVRVDPYAGPVRVILEQDDEGFTGNIEGKILNPGKDGGTAGRSALTFHTRAGADGDLTALTPGTSVLERRGARAGVYVPVQSFKLTTLADEQGYEFRDAGGAGRIYSPRARLYEALPSALLGLTAGSGSGTVMRDGSGGWAKVFMSDGERTAGSSTTGTGRHGHALGWDMRRQGLEIGYDFPADETLRLGFGAGQRAVKAAVMHGGDIKAKAFGGTLTLGWRPDGGFHVDGHLSYAAVNGIELSPAGGGAVIKADGGSGMSVGVSAGTEMDLAGMKVTPRAGLEWSSVKTGGFTEPAAVEGSGEVSEITAQGLKGTLGARIDMEAGESGTFWVSADAEHDLKDETSVTVPGAVLKVEMKPTWGRLGFGGEFRLSGMMTVSGSAFYAMAGGGNKDLGGSLALNVSF